jgi:transcription initiation factor TFIIIB Brf1 subunit/transcription initiation factor TFIIB
MNCKNCNSNNLYEVNEIICGDCGVVQSSIFSEYHFDKSTYNVSLSNGTDKLTQWNSYTNKEKSEYKLNKYTENLCSTLNITPNLIQDICNTVMYVMNVIKKNDSTKRSNVKDGIILVCIQYVSKSKGAYCSHTDLAKNIGVDIKYITRAEKLITEMIHSKKINLDGFDKINIINPYEYIKFIIKKNNIEIPDNFLDKTQQLIDECNKKQILSNYSPISIGTCCLYYILNENHVDVNLKTFSNIFNISGITINKTSKILLSSKLV